MTHSALSPVFTALKLGLHALVVALIALVVVRSLSIGGSTAAPAIALAALMLVSYALGAVLAARARRAAAAADTTSSGDVPHRHGTMVITWLVLLSIEWIALVLLSPDAAYLVFPLFFLYLHLLPRTAAVPAVVVATVAAILAIGVHAGFSVGGVVGPLVGAAVAVAIGLGYEALAREAAERERLIAELVAAREELADRGREAGKLAERERLAAELHDTVAQALSSIQLLLHAAERTATDGARSGPVGSERPEPSASSDTDQLRAHIALAREAAATALAETRNLIDELSPPSLVGSTIADALERLAATTTAQSGIPVTVTVTGDPVATSTPVTTALLRVSQSSLANVVRHAGAGRADVTLSYLDEEVIIDIDDDGVGFEPDEVVERSVGGSFGIVSMRRRIAELGGEVEVRSSPGAGTTVTARFAEPGREDVVVDG